MEELGGSDMAETKVRNAEMRTWQFDKFHDFFNREAGKKGNSEIFRAVTQAFEEYERVRNQPANQQSAMNLLNANKALMEACEKYAAERKGAMSSSGQARLDAVTSLMEFQKNQNLDEIRDMRVVRGLAGKTWAEAGAIPVAEVTINGPTEKVGANISQRLKVEYNGKKGFFTERREVNSLEKSFNDMIKGLDKKKESDRKKLLEGNKGLILGTLKLTEKSTTSENSIRSQIEFGLSDGWNKMVPKGETSGIKKQREKEKYEFGKAVVGDANGMQQTVKIMDTYFKKLKAEGKQTGSFRRMLLLEQAIAESPAEDSLKTILRENQELLIDMPVPDPALKMSTVNHMRVKAEFIQAKAAADEKSFSGRREIVNLNRLIADDKSIKDWVGMKLEADANEAGTTPAAYKLDEGNEMTSRNVATSRIAELLGVGGLVAHSRKMVAHIGDRTVTGSFMEFAEGTDYSSKDYVDQRNLSQIDEIETAEFNHDACHLEVLDYICGQGDRHGANMFYKLSEPDENGKRSIVGLQGIDNDLSFGDMADVVSDKSANLYTMTFIGKDLADKVRALDRATLEYAVGDLLPERQIEALLGRVDKMKNRIETGMVELNPDEWKLDEYKLEDYKQYNITMAGAKLEERELRYVKGLKVLELNRNIKSVGFAHRLQFAQKMVNDSKERFEAYENEQEEIFEGFREAFKEEPVKETAEKTVSEKAAPTVPERKAPERTAPEKAAPTVPERKAASGKSPAGRQRVSFADLGKTESSPRKRSFLSEKAQAPKEKQAENRRPERGMSAGKR